MRIIRRIAIHHTGDMPVPADQVTADIVDRLHLSQGWEGIGYHRLVRTSGMVERGRHLAQVGAHVLGFNSDTIGIALAGNYQRGQPPTVQWMAAVRLAALLAARFNLPVESILGHNEFPGASTVCPGFSMIEFRNAVLSYRASPPEMELIDES